MRVIFDRDHYFHGKTLDMKMRGQQLHAVGIQVVLAHGESTQPHYAAVGRKGGFRGIVHAKAALVGPLLLCGSANWTTSTRANRELSTLSRLDSEPEEEVRVLFQSWYDLGYTLAEAEKASEQRKRSKSRATLSPTRSRSMGPGVRLGHE